MSQLFDYFQESDIKRIKISIGQSIKNVVANTFKDKGKLPEQYNNIDRMKFAENFINKKLANKFKFDIFSKWYKTTREFDRCEFENDIAQYMDLKIPYYYYLELSKLNKVKGTNSNKFLYKGINSLEGFKFLYNENYVIESELLNALSTIQITRDRVPITYKQLKYLKRLIKYANKSLRVEDMAKCNSLKNEIEIIGIQNLTLEEAKLYIATFVNFEELYKKQYEE